MGPVAKIVFSVQKADMALEFNFYDNKRMDLGAYLLKITMSK